MISEVQTMPKDKNRTMFLKPNRGYCIYRPSDRVRKKSKIMREFLGILCGKIR